MFIYKITVDNKIYIGFDTKESHKHSRWKTHCRDAIKNPAGLVHKTMNEVGIENCQYEIISDGYKTIAGLAVAEIEYIKEHDSYRNGLNSSPGGDGIGIHDLTKLSDSEIAEIKQALSKSLSDYNNTVKWAGTTFSDRQRKTKHLHNSSVYQQKSKTLKETYAHNPGLAISKSKPILKWQAENREQLCKQNKKNGLLGATKVSKQIKIINPFGEELFYESKSAFARKHGFILKSIISKTKNGSNHNGWQGWEL